MRLPRPSGRAVVIAAPIVVVAITAAGIAATASSEPAASSEDATARNTTTVQRTDLAEYSTFDAVLELGEQRSVVTASGGTLLWAPSVGSVLEQGEELYALSDTPTDAELAAARAQQESARTQEATAAAQLDELVSGSPESELAAAMASVIAAENALTAVSTPATSSAIASAEAQVAAASSALDTMVNGPSDAEIAAADAQVAQAASAVTAAENQAAQARDALDAALDRYCALPHPPVDVCASTLPLTSAELAALAAASDDAAAGGHTEIAAAVDGLLAASRTDAAAQSSLLAAESALNAAKAGRAQLTAPPSSAAIAKAEADLELATEALDDLRAAPDPDRVAEAEASLASAQARLAALEQGASAAQIEAAQQSVRSAIASVDAADESYVNFIDADAAPVLLYGHEPLARSLVEGDEGRDVEQLQANLAALGYDVERSGIFDAGTRRSVDQWRSDRGVVASAPSVGPDEVVFLPGPVRIDSWAPTTEIGAVALPSTVLLVATPVSEVPVDPSDGMGLVSSQTVVADVPLDERPSISEGAAVTVRLPDRSEVAGTVGRIGVVPVEDLQTGDTWIEVTVLPDQAIDDVWIGASVEVEVAVEQAADVLAVPVTALLALAEGGYAVEVVRSGGGVELVGVDAGRFADGLVEIVGAVAEGDEIVVAG